MNHVFELFRNLKIKKKRHEESFEVDNLVCEEVVTSKLIPCCLFSIKIRIVVIQFHIKKCVHLG